MNSDDNAMANALVRVFSDLVPAGTPVRKNFPGYGCWDGKVTGMCGAQYLIQWNDGSESVRNRSEVNKYVEMYRKALVSKRSAAGMNTQTKRKPKQQKQKNKKKREQQRHSVYQAPFFYHDLLVPDAMIIATSSQESPIQQLRQGNKLPASGQYGVSRRGKSYKWQAKVIQPEGAELNLGTFSTKARAAHTYDQEVRRLQLCQCRPLNYETAEAGNKAADEAEACADTCQGERDAFHSRGQWRRRRRGKGGSCRSAGQGSRSG